MFNSKEDKCIFEVLKILEKGKSKYGKMFRTTKVSHTTLQRVLKELEKRSFIIRYDIGHMNVDYDITIRGKRLFNVLLELYSI